MKRVFLAAGLIGASFLLPMANAHEGEHAPDISERYAPAAFIEAPEPLACTLETGTETRCLKLTVRHKPSDLSVGPFCPTHLDTPGGIWNWTGESAGLYRVDEAFLRMIAAQGFTMFDETGDVYISDIAQAAPSQAHSCIEVSEDETVEITALIPLTPEMAETPKQLGIVNKIGMALNGTPIFSDAPSVHHTGHMPALDTCGGHVDPGGWYHWHANATDIETVFDAQHVEASCGLQQDPAALFGYAFDGFPIYGSTEPSGATPDDLDACGGHVGRMADGQVGYHYHTTETFPNLPKCLVGVPAQNNFTTTAQVGIGANPPEGREITRRNPPRGPRDPARFTNAAQQLGVSVEELHQALQQAGGRPPNFAAIAEQLGVAEHDVRSALPPPGRKP